FASPDKGLKQYQAGKYEASLREYQRALKEKPTDPRLQYNAGAAAYQAKDYDKAAEYLSGALLTPDLQLQQRAYYNLGNTHFRLGTETSEASKKQEAWESAIQNYESALKLNQQDPDAKYNMEVVKQKLEELKKQQQQNQQNKDGDNKDQKDQKDDKQQQDKKDQQNKQDQKSQENKDGNKSDEQKKQEQQKKDQQQQQQKQKEQEEKEKQDQQQQSQDAKKQDPSKDEKKEAKKGNEGKGQPGEKGDKAEQAARAMMMMSPQQAAQLLDTLKDEEKAMRFVPENTQPKNKPTDRIFKDW
ncbi:MAG: Mg-chelatase subunit ChlD, partial [Verrucomicrobiales bacterium]|nr:Mg-chelatase subunit ChlD [Verrucomicrobiales bacterium]